jgi:hypothetical protein
LVPPTSPRTSVNTLLVRSQWASLAATSTRMRALPSGGQLDAVDPADRETREGQVHADHHAVRIVGDQHQALGGLKRAARIHHIQRRAAHQQQHEEQQQPGLELQAGDFRRRGLGLAHRLQRIRPAGRRRGGIVVG